MQRERRGEHDEVRHDTNISVILSEAKDLLSRWPEKGSGACFVAEDDRRFQREATTPKSQVTQIPQITQMAAVKPQSHSVFGFTAAICVICGICGRCSWE
jgi:hypothetical protein